MKTPLRLLVLFLAVSVGAQAFIPPLPTVLKEVFDGRKGGSSWEVVLRHRIEPHPSEVFLLDEKILSDRGRVYFFWSGAGLSHPIAAQLERHAYNLGQGKTLSTASVVFDRYLAGMPADGMRDILMAEGFLRRDQLYTFAPGFTLEGEPQTWNLKEKYLRHDDVYLHRVGPVVAIAVAGTNEENRKRVIYFDRSLRGVRKLEWKDGETVASWTFEGLGSGTSPFPHRLLFELNGAQVVTSDVLSFRAPSSRQTQEFQSAWKQASRDNSLSGNAEVMLKLLLGYR